MAHRDPVTEKTYQAVMARDYLAMKLAGLPSQRPICIAPIVDSTQLGRCSGRSTLDHVHEAYGMMGRRAPSDEEHLVALCERHHLWSGWATSHKPALREYLLNG